MTGDDRRDAEPAATSRRPPSCRRGCSPSARARSHRSSSSPPPSSAPHRRWRRWWSRRPGSARSLADIPAGTDRAPLRRTPDDDRRRRADGAGPARLHLRAQPRGLRGVRSSSPASGTAVWLLARQAYVTEVVPVPAAGHGRCRRSAGCSGSACSSGRSSAARWCTVTGLWGAYAVHIVAALVAAGVLLVVKDLSTGTTAHAVPDAATQGAGRPGGPRAAVGLRHARRRACWWSARSAPPGRWCCRCGASTSGCRRPRSR